MKPLLLLVMLIACGVSTQAKPLKVFILAGQSNMEGHARVETFWRPSTTSATMQRRHRS